MAIFNTKVKIKNNLDESSDVVTMEDSIQEKSIFGISFFKKTYNRETNIDKKNSMNLGFNKK